MKMGADASDRMYEELTDMNKLQTILNDVCIIPSNVSRSLKYSYFNTVFLLRLIILTILFALFSIWTTLI